MNITLSTLNSLFIVFSLLITNLVYSQSTQPQKNRWWWGASKIDFTYEVLGESMMGYGDSSLRAQGLHTKLYIRTFAMKNDQHSPSLITTIVDLPMISPDLYLDVIKKLKLKWGKKFTSFFREELILLSATHTHSSHGGHFSHRLYKIAGGGFSKEKLEWITLKIVQSIEEALKNSKIGTITLASGEIDHLSFNQSLIPYQANNDSFDFDFETPFNNEMLQLNFFHHNETLGGILNWFALHPTSLSKNETLLSGDHKGVASLLVENIVEKENSFVAAFANSDEGDISSLTAATDQLSDIERSLYTGSEQAFKALSLLEKANEVINSPLYAVKENLNLNLHPDLCPAALGYSFAAGSEDGPSNIPFFFEGMVQGQITDQLGFLPRFLLKLATPLTKVSPSLNECHYPKPVLINLAQRNTPWVHTDLPFSLVAIGPLILIVTPFEVTTMAARRIKKKVMNELQKSLASDFKLVMASLSNDYAGYLTTFEEYQLQHYEGASTHYGPNTLKIIEDHFQNLARKLAQKMKSTSSPNHKVFLSLKNKSSFLNSELSHLKFQKDHFDIVHQKRPLARQPRLRNSRSQGRMEVRLKKKEQNIQVIADETSPYTWIRYEKKNSQWYAHLFWLKDKRILYDGEISLWMDFNN